MASTAPAIDANTNFIRQMVEDDIKSGKHTSVVTRFPPEPNGFLHLGHAKSICLNFGLAKEFGGRCHLRFDDTNPEAEDDRYVQAIKTDIEWLGFSWGNNLFYASDYFDHLYEWAIKLIKDGKAYVDHQTPEEIHKNRGDLHTPGIDSSFRTRSIEENLVEFEKMKNGVYRPGDCVLRAKINMADPSPVFRDPIMYRILDKHHWRTGDKWKIYPMYDYAHGQSDSLEGITHSICTLEFIVNRPLYEWFQEAIDIPRTQQIEFARLNLRGVVMSKRHLQTLVKTGTVRDWDDPRMPTISAMRRRGFPASGVRNFCKQVGVAKRKNTIEYDLFEFCMQEELHKLADRYFAVVDPIKVTVVNFPEGEKEEFEAPLHPDDKCRGTRNITFERNLFIDRSDFMEEPSKDFFRLAPGKEVRLKYAYWVKCEEVVKDDSGKVVELKVTYDPQTRNGVNPPDGRKVKGTIHWLSTSQSLEAELRMYNQLFLDDSVFEDKENFYKHANPESLVIVNGLVDKNIKSLAPGSFIQFERHGFFSPDSDSTESKLVLNRSLKQLDNFGNKDAQKEKNKEAERIAREKANEERARTKAERERKAAEKAAAKAK